MSTLTAGQVNGSLIGELGTLTAGDIAVVRQGSARYDNGLDLSGVELDSFIVGSSFDGTIGGPGSSVLLDLDGATYTGLFEYSSRGSFAYVAPTAAIATARIYQTGSVGVFFTAGEVTVLEVQSGLVEFNSSCDVPTLSVAGGFVKARTHASQAVDTVTVLGGTFQTERNIGTATVYGGALSIIEPGVTATSVTVGPGSTFRHSGGNVTTLIAQTGAVIDFSGLTEDITITNATRWPGVTYIAPPQGITVTVTNTTEVLGGGTFAT